MWLVVSHVLFPEMVRYSRLIWYNVSVESKKFIISTIIIPTVIGVASLVPKCHYAADIPIDLTEDVTKQVVICAYSPPLHDYSKVYIQRVAFASTANYATWNFTGTLSTTH